MSGEDIKTLVAIVAQQQAQFTQQQNQIASLIEIVKKRTEENTPAYQVALDLQNAQKARHALSKLLTIPNRNQLR